MTPKEVMQWVGVALVVGLILVGLFYGIPLLNHFHTWLITKDFQPAPGSIPKGPLGSGPAGPPPKIEAKETDALIALREGLASPNPRERKLALEVVKGFITPDNEKAVYALAVGALADPDKDVVGAAKDLLASGGDEAVNALVKAFSGPESKVVDLSLYYLGSVAYEPLIDLVAAGADEAHRTRIAKIFQRWLDNANTKDSARDALVRRRDDKKSMRVTLWVNSLL